MEYQIICKFKKFIIFKKIRENLNEIILISHVFFIYETISNFGKKIYV